MIADFNHPAVIADPFPALHALMENDPMYWHEGLKSWCLTRYADVRQAYSDPRFASARIGPFVARKKLQSGHLDELSQHISRWLVFTDPPTHTRLRKLTQQAFSRRSVAALRHTIAQLVDELLDRVCDSGEMDFVRDFAYPLPANVIADMLGVPREYVDDLKRWSDDLALFVLSSRHSENRHELAAQSLARMNELFDRLIREKQKSPGNKVMDSLIGAHADGDRLTRTELIAFCVLLLFAGHETTTHFFSNGLRALLLHPGQMRDLRENFGQRAVLTGALDEMLRWDGPILAVSRYLLEDLEWGGKALGKGERVYLFSAAANRDPRVFAEPDKFDIRRTNANRMLAFGFGIHLCLGIHLARLEAEIGFPILLKRLKNIKLKEAKLDWADTLVIRGPKAMPVSFEIA